MKEVISPAYATLLFSLSQRVHIISEDHPLYGRLLSLPLGLFLLISLPLIRCAVFLECIALIIITSCCASFSDTMGHIRTIPNKTIGLILCPLIAPFVAIALASAMIVNPITASKRFSSTCRVMGTPSH